LSFQCQTTLILTVWLTPRSVVKHCLSVLCWHGTLLKRHMPRAAPSQGGRGVKALGAPGPLCGYVLANMVRSQCKKVKTFKFFVGINK